MEKKLDLRLIAAAGLLLLLAAGCRAVHTPAHQQELARLYYGGDVAGAARYASAISGEEKDNTSGQALLWHLEAGSVNLDAGNFKESQSCLERAEKLLYLFDGSAPRFHRPGPGTYRGTRSDRILLHLLKGFNYLEENKLEDFLVEIRRLRAEQFRYVLDEADPGIRLYEAKNSGRSGVVPFAMRDLAAGKGEKSLIFRAAQLNDAFLEYSQRRRPRLPLLYNPLAFYLSALAYAFDNDYEEAVIDFRYLLMLDPLNPLYRQDCAALLTALGDGLPEELKGTPKTAAPDDQVVCFIVGRGCPDAWASRKLTYLLPGKVPTDWSFSYPDRRPQKDPGFSVQCGGRTVAAGSHLADLSEIANEEYWQQIFPGMVDRAYKATLAMTAAHTAAKASLATALAMPSSDYKPIVVAAARASVAATSRASVNQLEWRRWITLPRSYSVAHVRLPLPGSSRKMTLAANTDGGSVQTFDLDFAPETNRAVVYLRDIGNGRFVLKKWESME